MTDAKTLVFTTPTLNCQPYTQMARLNACARHQTVTRKYFSEHLTTRRSYLVAKAINSVYSTGKKASREMIDVYDQSNL